MASRHPRSNRSKSHSRSRESSKPSHRPSGQQRARQDSPRSLLVVAVFTSVVALPSDVATTRFVVAAYRRIGHIHLDLRIAVMGVVCTIVALIAWRAWWKARRLQIASRVAHSKTAIKKESI